MALSEYKSERRAITLKSASFEVQAISLEILARLIKTHLADIELMFDITEGQLKGRKDFNEKDLSAVAMSLAEQAPLFVASIIAHAAGEDTPEANAAALSLPALKQVEILSIIGELTFQETGGVKKSIELVTNLLNKTKSLKN